MSQEVKRCLVCEQDSHTVPLMPFEFHGQSYWICPQHLPILIHKPASLADKLPGAELLGPPAGH
jgi:hypothetical protein